jgi:hypothetical protein
MIKLPSNIAAILTGAIIMPLYIMGFNYAQEQNFNQLVSFLWSVIGFIIPVFMSTADLGYLRRTGGFLKIRRSKEDFDLFFIPAWKRMTVWFLSAAVSVLLLKLLGIKVI